MNFYVEGVVSFNLFGCVEPKSAKSTTLAEWIRIESTENGLDKYLVPKYIGINMLLNVQILK